MRLLGPTLESVPVPRPIPTEDHPQGLCLDRGYDYDACRDLARGQRFVPHVRGRGEEIDLKQADPEWRARRRVVEACHSWMLLWFQGLGEKLFEEAA